MFLRDMTPPLTMGHEFGNDRQGTDLTLKSRSLASCENLLMEQLIYKPIEPLKLARLRGRSFAYRAYLLKGVVESYLARDMHSQRDKRCLACARRYEVEGISTFLLIFQKAAKACLRPEHLPCIYGGPRSSYICRLVQERDLGRGNAQIL